jgi:hypothetical protein
MVIANAGIIHHVFQVADDFGGGEVAASGGDQRLVHVQRDGKRAADFSEIYPAVGLKNRFRAIRARCGFDAIVQTADVREMIGVFRKVTHDGDSVFVATSGFRLAKNSAESGGNVSWIEQERLWHLIGSA